MPGTTHQEAHHEPTDRRLPTAWRWWVPAIILLALYVLCLVLHWTHQIDRIPTGVSTLAHLGVVVLFVGGCVAPLFELRDLTVARALAEARESHDHEHPDADLQSQVADLQRWRREMDSPNVVGLSVLRQLKNVDDRLQGTD